MIFRSSYDGPGRLVAPAGPPFLSPVIIPRGRA